jgi:hypothetical protein
VAMRGTHHASILPNSPKIRSPSRALRASNSGRLPVAPYQPGFPIYIAIFVAF